MTHDVFITRLPCQFKQWLNLCALAAFAFFISCSFSFWRGVQSDLVYMHASFPSSSHVPVFLFCLFCFLFFLFFWGGVCFFKLFILYFPPSCYALGLKSPDGKRLTGISGLTHAHNTYKRAHISSCFVFFFLRFFQTIILSLSLLIKSPQTTTFLIKFLWALFCLTTTFHL